MTEERRRESEVTLSAHTLPPPQVAGLCPAPYPRVTSSWDNTVLDREWEAHAREALPPLREHAVHQVALRGFSRVVFSRQHERPWALNMAAVQEIMSYVEHVGLARTSEYNDPWSAWTLHAYLDHALDDQQWFAPRAVPRLTGPLEAFLSAALAGRKPARDPIFPGERALHGELRQRDADEYDPWRSRESRRQIELMIRATGRITPYRLRPVVLVTENAARRRWYYGGWAVYDVLPSGAIGACLAIHGKPAHGNHGAEWHGVDWEDGFERPHPTEAHVPMRWHGWWLSEREGYTAHAEIHCALTGDVLSQGALPTAAAARRDDSCFLPTTPAAVPESDEHDVVSLLEGAL